MRMAIGQYNAISACKLMTRGGVKEYSAGIATYYAVKSPGT